MKFLLCEHLLVCLYIICFSQIPSNKSSLYLHCSWVHESLQSVSPSTLCLIPSLSVILPFRLEWCTSDSPLDHPIPYKSTSPPFTTCVTLSNVPFFLKSLWIRHFFFFLVILHLRPFQQNPKSHVLSPFLFFLCALKNNFVSVFFLSRPLCDPGHSRLWAASWEGHRKLPEGSFWRIGFREHQEWFMCTCPRGRQHGPAFLWTHHSVPCYLWYYS